MQKKVKDYKKLFINGIIKLHSKLALNETLQILFCVFFERKYLHKWIFRQNCIVWNEKTKEKKQLIGKVQNAFFLQFQWRKVVEIEFSYLSNKFKSFHILIRVFFTSQFNITAFYSLFLFFGSEKETYSVIHNLITRNK